jgi:hypothetical protein
MLLPSPAPSNPGPWVREVRAIFHDEGGETEGEDIFWDNINIILRHTPNLAVFDTGTLIRASALMIISIFASSNLTTLKCYLDGGSTMSMRFINSFRALSTLEVLFHNDTKPNFSTITPWILPAVRQFEWSYDGDAIGDFAAPDNASLHFLASCRFHPACHMEITIPHLEPTQSLILNPFFDAHKEAVSIVFCVWNPVAASSTIMSVENTVEFTLEYPPAMAFARDRLPKRISMKSAQSTGEGNIWDILDVLESHGHFERKVMLQIRWELGGFTWHKEPGKEVSEEYEMFAGRLLHYALRLYEIGVVILDQDGKELDEHIRRARIAMSTPAC